jgi:hypothetical protein
MPNHCEQDLVITGTTDQLKAFQEFAKEDNNLLSENKFIPYPEKFRLLDDKAKVEREKGNYDIKDGFNSGGYEWCIKNWGTKWGIYSCVITYEKFDYKKNVGKIKYTFKSAWSPASLIINAMSKKFPELDFQLQFFEFGVGYCGKYYVKNSDVYLTEEKKYKGRRGG